MANEIKIYLTKAKYKAMEDQLEFMEGEGTLILNSLLASSPGSGMGRPLDLPIHELARRYFSEIQDIKGKLLKATIIDEFVGENSKNGVVGIGATVHITYVNYNDKEMFTILGPDEADPDNGKISHLSPLGSLLMGMKEGDIETLKTNSTKIRVDNIEFNSLDFNYSPKDWKKILENTVV